MSLNHITDGPKRFLIIIGAMKAGTTYLYNLLRQHPAICSASNKEPNYFVEHEQPSLQGYSDCFPEWDENIHKYALEGSVNYTKVPAFPDCAKRMATIKGVEYKFVYLIRDPVERIRSHYRHVVRSGIQFRIDENDIDQNALDISAYAMQLDRYLTYFPKGNIKIIQFEEFIADPEPITNQIFNLLNIDPMQPTTHIDANKARSRFMQPWIYTLRRKLPVRFSLRKYVPNFLYRISNRNITRFDLTEKHVSIIRRYLADDMMRLQKEYNISIDKWVTKSD
jgi:hypothetical protein